MKLLPLAAVCCAACFAQSVPSAFRGAADIDASIAQAIRRDQIPGAVILIGHNGRVVFQKAYGYRSLMPAKEPMTPDTVFDIASLTKVVASTSAIMKLDEQGKVRIDDPVTEYLPEFQNGSSPVTVRDLMTHFSGLRPDVDLEPAWSGYDAGIHKAVTDKPAGAPEARFVYSDINFVLIGEIIRRVSGMPENEYVKQILFDPLGMKDTGYLPPASLLSRIAPTEMQQDGTVLRGVVHDPTARYMGGVAGHAGVFSTAADLGKFCQMILDGGDGLFSPATIRRFTEANSPPNQPVVRGLGWDIQSPYSGVRGDLFPVGSFGHTGFTGTSIWIDPASKTYVVMLTNSVHPHARKAITPLRGRIATIAAAAVAHDAATPAPDAIRARAATRTGLDVLERESFAAFAGKRIGLITNQTGVDREGRRNVDVMRAAGVNVAALFSPEHGIDGVEDHTGIGDSVDPATGIRIYSLYGKTRRPTPEMLRGLDALVFDIQDVGVRFYTYESTMIYAMEEAAKAGLPFYVLDRPDPLTGLHVEGPMLDPARLSFTGSFPLPLRHGMTIGELASLVNGERGLHANLIVIPMTGWTRDQWFDQTGLPWRNPSPNIRSLNEAILYPALAMLESSTGYSVGRGTDTPFELIGASWIRGEDLAGSLGRADVPGVRYAPVRFTPSSSGQRGRTLSGLAFTLTDRDAFSASKLGLGLAAAIAALYPAQIDFQKNIELIGSERVVRALAGRGNALSDAQTGLPEFLAVRRRYLIYP